MDAAELKSIVMSRRSAIKGGGASAFLVSQAVLFERLGWAPRRSQHPSTTPTATTFSDIQFDMAAFIDPAQVIDDGAGAVTVGFPPVYTLFLPVTLNRTPTRDEQASLADALTIIEASYPASPSGLLIFSVSHGLPYFSRLPRAMVDSVMPTLLANPGRFVLEEAVPFATDVTDGLVGGPGALIPNVTKDRFNVNVQIESNDMLFHFRSDSLVNLSAAALWLQGSNNLDGRHVPSPDFHGLFSFQAPRIQFVQPGLPRKMADEQGFEFAPRINPDSPMAMGFVDQQVNASGPAAIVTFAGNTSARLTSAVPGDYFDNGSVAHFSHVIEDLYQFYSLPGQDPRHADGEPFTERCQYMFRSNQLGTTNGIPAAGNTDQFTNGGGPAFVNNVFQGTGAALLAAHDTAGLFTPANQTLSDVHRPAPHRPRGGAGAGVAGGRRHAAAHPGRRPRPRQHGRTRLPDLPRTGRERRPGRQQAVQAAVPDIRADRRPVRPDAHRRGGTAASAAVPGRRSRRQRPGAVHHRDPAAELPGPAAQAPGLPVAGTH